MKIWEKWQLCRFMEIAVEIMRYGVNRGISPLPTLESLFEEKEVRSHPPRRIRAVVREV
jgi:hypothetical protein